RPQVGFLLWGTKIVTNIPTIDRIPDAIAMYQVINTLYDDSPKLMYKPFEISNNILNLEHNNIIRNPHQHNNEVFFYNVPHNVNTFVINKQNIEWLNHNIREALFKS